MKKFTLLFSVAIFFSMFLDAQNEAYNAFRIAQDSASKNPENYLAPLLALKQIEFNSNDALSKNIMAQALMTYYSFAGDYKNALRASDSRYPNYSKIDHLPITYDSSFVEEHQFLDATEYILQEIENKQVVMVNEAHHIPLHRSYVLGLLKDFYKKGFRYFALETLHHAKINDQGYPNFESGFYSREPLFSEMLREALKLGFTLVHYENDQKCNGEGKDRSYCNSFRDSIQAQYLKDRILQNNPKAKILVFAGYAHIEKESKNGWKKMAQYFQELTGIEPYCIDQTKMIEKSKPIMESKLYRSIVDLVKPEAPIVALKNNKPIANSNFVDLSIIHPRSALINDRPDFYSISGKRKTYSLDKHPLKKGYLAQAFYKNEKRPRVPADQFIVKTGKESLFLFPGEYEIVIRNSKGLLVKEEEIVLNKK